MVVTRRTPVVPPPLARNHSSHGAQHPPRSSVARDFTVVSRSPVSSVPAVSVAGPSNGSDNHQNGLDNDSGKKSKKSRRRSRNKYEKSNFQALLDFLTKLLLLAFTIYTFSVCPQDTHLQSPICRGLTEYKRIIIDPYIIPPIHALLAHPSIAPHIDQMKPYVDHAVEVTSPILLRAQQEWNLRVVPQWEKRIVPAWNERVVPQWNKYIVPQWDRHVAPQIQFVQSKVQPHLLRVTQEYEHRIAPHARVAMYNLRRWQRQAEPYVLLAASKTKDGYYAAKPYAVPLAKKSGHLLQQLALFLREQRQKFVDPHVAKMWEKVKELSSGDQVTSERDSLSSDILFTVLDTDTSAYEITVSSTDFIASVYDNIPIPEATDVAHILSSLSAGNAVEEEPTFTTAPEPSASTQPADTFADIESFVIAESVVTMTLHESEDSTSDASSFMKEIDSATSSILAPGTTALSSSSKAPATADKSTSSLSSVTPSKIAVPAASATVPPANSRTDDEIDLDAFYAELGLNDPLVGSGSSDEFNSIPPNPPTETKEEMDERLRRKAEETAKKRADIEARQAKWESELEAQMDRSTAQLQSRLGDLRTAAAAELAVSAEVRGSIEELVSEAEKYLKGAEIYLKNLKGENRKSDEKLALWDRVADRVSDKFSERLSATKNAVDAWYKLVLDKELEEVVTAATEVRDVAEKGQLDLGLDYAWLEDVTYNDWQRYHALIGVSEQYAQEVASIQNGTHPTVVVANLIIPIFEDLESEIQDVVIGFETRLRRIKRDGERAFNNHNNGATQKEEEKGSSVEPERGAEPHVSILPVPHQEEEQKFIPPVVIGRSQREVLEALGKVEPVGEVELPANVDPEEAVSLLAREVGSGADHHTEL